MPEVFEGLAAALTTTCGESHVPLPHHAEQEVSHTIGPEGRHSKAEGPRKNRELSVSI